MKKIRILSGLLLLLLILLVFVAHFVAGKPGVADGKKNEADSNITTRDVKEAMPHEVLPSMVKRLIGEEINWQVISSGGDIGGASTDFILSGTVGQTAMGTGGSDIFGLSHGFWQEFDGAGPCDCIPGDANNDDQINVGDAVYLINYIFRSGPGPIPYPVCSGDANGDCTSNVGDAVYLINYVFKGGPPPVICEEWRASCGPDMFK